VCIHALGHDSGGADQPSPAHLSACIRNLASTGESTWQELTRNEAQDFIKSSLWRNLYVWSTSLTSSDLPTEASPGSRIVVIAPSYSKSFNPIHEQRTPGRKHQRVDTAGKPDGFCSVHGSRGRKPTQEGLEKKRMVVHRPGGNQEMSQNWPMALEKTNRGTVRCSSGERC